MKEITRIHIAKVAYDIEIGAKKELEKYIHKLEAYTADEDLMQDIEIRMTEILAQQDVVAGGLITAKDVEVVTTQLGAPEEFLDDGGAVATSAEPVETGSWPYGRKLYRDENDAVIGGVLAGLAKFFGTTPVVTRVIFLILFFTTAGTPFLVYILLWVLIPPAKTPAQKLEQDGKPVTAETIKDLRASEEIRKNETARTVRKLLMYTLGAGCLVGMLTAIALTVSGAFVLNTVLDAGLNKFSHTIFDEPMARLAVMILSVLSGLLLASLFALGAVASFKRSLSKRMFMSMIVVAAVGIICASVAAGFGTLWAAQNERHLNESSFVKKVDLPSNFSVVKHLVVDSPAKNKSLTANVEYIVDDTAPAHYEMRLNDTNKTSRAEVKVAGDTATLTLDFSDGEKEILPHMVPQITVYGPVLDNIEAKTDDIQYTAKHSQENIALSANDHDVRLIGAYKNVSATVADDGYIDLRDANVQALTANVQNGKVEAGGLANLAITSSDSCPAHDNDIDDASGTNRILAQSISSGKITVNGAERTAETWRTGCMKLLVGDDAE